MPIEFSSDLRQIDRVNSATNSNFFHLINGEDIDFSVQKIMITGSTLPSPLIPGSKFLRGHGGSFSPHTLPATSGTWDILRWNGLAFETYLYVQNPETNFGLIYNREDGKWYQFVDTTEGWKPIIRSGKIDGGTWS